MASRPSSNNSNSYVYSSTQPNTVGNHHHIQQGHHELSISTAADSFPSGPTVAALSMAAAANNKIFSTQLILENAARLGLLNPALLSSFAVASSAAAAATTTTTPSMITAPHPVPSALPNLPTLLRILQEYDNRPQQPPPVMQQQQQQPMSSMMPLETNSYGGYNFHKFMSDLQSQQQHLHHQQQQQQQQYGTSSSFEPSIDKPEDAGSTRRNSNNSNNTKKLPAVGEGELLITHAPNLTFKLVSSGGDPVPIPTSTDTNNDNLILNGATSNNAAGSNNGCCICDAPASGMHYGARTCEGCKGFFKRSLALYRSYRCYFAWKCQVTTETRGRCKACRFLKCINNGMSLQGIRMGRIPKAVKQQRKEQQPNNNNTITASSSSQSHNLNNPLLASCPNILLPMVPRQPPQPWRRPTFSQCAKTSVFLFVDDDKDNDDDEQQQQQQSSSIGHPFAPHQEQQQQQRRLKRRRSGGGGQKNADDDNNNNTAGGGGDDDLSSNEEDVAGIFAASAAGSAAATASGGAAARIDESACTTIDELIACLRQKTQQEFFNLHQSSSSTATTPLPTPSAATAAAAAAAALKMARSPLSAAIFALPRASETPPSSASLTMNSGSNSRFSPTTTARMQEFINPLAAHQMHAQGAGGSAAERVQVAMNNKAVNEAGQSFRDLFQQHQQRQQQQLSSNSDEELTSSSPTNGSIEPLLGDGGMGSMLHAATSSHHHELVMQLPTHSGARHSVVTFPVDVDASSSSSPSSATYFHKKWLALSTAAHIFAKPLIDIANRYFFCESKWALQKRKALLQSDGDIFGPLMSPFRQVRLMTRRVNRFITELVQFVQCVPQFNTLDANVQLAVMEGSLISTYLIIHYPSLCNGRMLVQYEIDDETVTDTEDWLVQVLGLTAVEVLRTASAYIDSMKLDEREAALLLACTILRPRRSVTASCQPLVMLARAMLVMLESVVLERRPDEGSKICNMINHLLVTQMLKVDIIGANIVNTIPIIVDEQQQQQPSNSSPIDQQQPTTTTNGEAHSQPSQPNDDNEPIDFSSTAQTTTSTATTNGDTENVAAAVAGTSSVAVTADNWKPDMLVANSNVHFSMETLRWLFDGWQPDAAAAAAATGSGVDEFCSAAMLQSVCAAEQTQQQPQQQQQSDTADAAIDAEINNNNIDNGNNSNGNINSSNNNNSNNNAVPNYIYGDIIS